MIWYGMIYDMIYDMTWYDIRYMIWWYDMIWYMIGLKINSQGFFCITLSVTRYLDFVSMCVFLNRRIKKNRFRNWICCRLQARKLWRHPLSRHCTTSPNDQKKIQFLKQYSILNMDENKLPKKILWTNAGGQWGRGRPKSRWTEGVEEDARKLGCRNSLVNAQDRGRWWHFLEEVKAHWGL
jgi:hypothetical protein